MANNTVTSAHVQVKKEGTCVVMATTTVTSPHVDKEGT